jgi:hypothetical protein
MTRKAASQPATTYEPTAEERDIVSAHHFRSEARKPAPRVTVTVNDGATQLDLDHPDDAVGHCMLAEAVGTTDLDFLTGLLKQVANASAIRGEVDERGLNFMLSVVRGIEPRDQTEAMLATQMAAVHSQTLTFARRLNHVENIPQQDSAERAFNKLARTFATQVEALKRYRSTGEQKVTVEHVTVNEGGQAIVGNVSKGGGGASKKLEPTT